MISLGLHRRGKADAAHRAAEPQEPGRKPTVMEEEPVSEKWLLIIKNTKNYES
jgi:hypothetical protein